MNNKLIQTTFTNIRFQNYEIKSDKGFFLDGKEINKGKYNVFLSLSDDKPFALATVIISL